MIEGNYFKETPAIPTNASLEKQVEKTLHRMSLEEKIGQMCQITLDGLIQKNITSGQPDTPYKLDPALVDTILGKYKVGSILNTAANRGQSREFWNKTISILQQKALSSTGIPLLYGVDAIHGVTYTIGGTLFPQQIAMAATFNEPLVEQSARITAYETRASNIPWNFSPVLDLGWDPRWPRMWETYGEDVFLTSTLGAACVKGYQGDDPNHIGIYNVAACLKHYLGYGAPRTGLDRTPAYIPKRLLREKHYAPFKRAIEAGALSVMVNSSIVNEISLHSSKALLSQWLKKDLQWDGMIVTDWGDIANLHTRDHIALDYKQAIKNTINAGVDLSMVPFDWKFCSILKELVLEHKVEIARINDAVRRILRLKYRLGLFDQPQWNLDQYPDFGSEKHADIALQAAEEAITLLKNDKQILPISKKSRILITGPNANSMRTLNGGWSLSWQGEKADELASEFHTIVEAFEFNLGKERVQYIPALEYKMDGKYYEELPARFDKVVAAAQQVDYIILCLGENSYCETPGNLFDMNLSEQQRELAKILSKTGKPIVLVLNEGRPRVVSSIEPLMGAVIQSYLPGNYGGDALANIILGKTNPSGRLPYTYPRYPSVFYTYDHKPSEWATLGKDDAEIIENPIQWPFGYGLSYTKFEYSKLQIRVIDNKGIERSTERFMSGNRIVAYLTVKNVGTRGGKESVLLYTSDEYASLSPDVKRLNAFSKVYLNPGEQKRIRLEFPANALAFIQAKNQWVLEEGYFTLRTGELSTKIYCVQSRLWTTPNTN